jgi:AcrR family transcriptional regulator
VPSETRASYHHGALRAELISASVALIEAEGIGAVSLRRVAREAGVSPGAPYHHFPDRAALLAAITVQGAGVMEERMRAARDGAPTAAAALRAVIETYVLFARDHPGYVHLMLRPELSAPHQEAKEAGKGALLLLTEIVTDCQREGAAPAGDPETLVHLVWSLAMGIVTLWLDGPLQHRCTSLGTTPEEMTTRIATLLTTALAAGAQSAGAQSAGGQSATSSTS